MSRRVRSARGPSRVDPNLTPLLDIVLQLITFFMMLIHFGTSLEASSAQVRLPQAPAALPLNDLGLDRIVATLDATGKLTIEGQDAVPPATGSLWKHLADRRHAGLRAIGSQADELSTVVVVRADRAATYGQVRDTLAAAQAAGFAHFTLVVLREPEPRP